MSNTLNNLIMILSGKTPRIIAVCLIAIFMMACNKDGGGGGGKTTNSSVGWYFKGGAPLFTEYTFPEAREDVVLFLDDGAWSPYHVWVPWCYEGEGVHLIQLPLPVEPEFIQIVDGQSLIHYTGLVYKYGASGAAGRKLLYKFNNKNHGKMAVYEGYSTYHTYTREGNNIIIKYEGEKQIITVTDGALWVDGGGKWTKYDPNTEY